MHSPRPPAPLPPCPHPGDPSHAGLGRAWCDAGREGHALLLAKNANCTRKDCGRPLSEHEYGSFCP